MKHIIMGTAGHVDHGKTTLVKRLTGVDTDRLKEEKQRGITIELGFAPLHLSDGQCIGIVDVPGHEKFIRNMLSGSTGIDFVLFVIAANEGVMPQTREHMDILRLLGVQNGVVALTKIDMVDPEWLELVREDVRDFLAESPLAGAKICEVSAVTGQGIPELMQEIEAVAAQVADRSSRGAARLPIDRVFSLSGFGTIVTGTLWKGTIELGQSMELFPSRQSVRVRSIQVHGEKRAAASAGERVAVNLTGVQKQEIPHGSWLSVAGALSNQYLIDIRLELLKSAPPLEHRARVHVHHGTNEVLAKVSLLDRDVLLPGESGFAQLELEEPLCPLQGDRVILRFYSPVYTIGGGVVLNPNARKHKRLDAKELEHLAALSSSDPCQRLLSAAEKSIRVWSTADITAFFSGDAPMAETSAQQLAADGSLVPLGSADYIAASALEELKTQALERLRAYCAAYPLRPGMQPGELWSALKLPGIAPEARPLLEAALRADSRFAAADGVLCPAGYVPAPDARTEKCIQDIRRALESAGRMPPAWSSLTAGMKPKDSSELLLWFLRRGELARIEDDVVYPTAVLTDAETALRESTGSSFTLSEARDALGISRKYAIYILDWLADNGRLRRDGDDRRWL